MRIRLSAEVTMPQAKKSKKTPAAKRPPSRNRRLSPERAKLVDEMLGKL